MQSTKRVVAAVCMGVILITTPSYADTDEYQKYREAMVTKQIIRRGIKSPQVLAALKKVPRHEFVPSEEQRRAYEDYPLPIGFGQTISQPFIVALMTERARLKEDDVVLEIGTGSGYQAAILGECVSTVYTIEIIPELAYRAKNVLQQLGYSNIHVKVGDGYLGWEEHAPFDVIIITAAAHDIPPPLVEQLKVGGHMVLPVDEGPGYQMLKIVRKHDDGSIREENIIPVRFVPLVRDKR
ncbi:MAG: protein-L-isoaspartate(D-aspartate) O-methyltransferase [Candidatus Omnitrophica bacterium]|nr:protein-L-isoaspartate(D-aspartate) O-methyltransferase [Candidatus Omnitrophota bacterium]